MITPTFYRAFREVNRVTGISITDDELVFTVREEVKKQPVSWFSWEGLIASLAVAAITVWMVLTVVTQW